VTSSFQSIDWHRFLARPRLPAHGALAALHGARVLITGAGGSIGSALALRMATLELGHLVLLESSESQLFALQTAIARAGSEPDAAFVLGGVSERALLDEIFATHRPRLVFHAAAYKQVPLLEEQPLAAITNNVVGTRILVEAAAAQDARVMLLSTDKAVEPASVMGATKRVAEQMVLQAGGTVVRLGNVLASRDSVAEVFARAIAAGEPMIVTDPAARRYFLTIEEAVDLLVTAAAEPHGLLAAALDAPHFIADLARFMAAELAPERETQIEFTHLRSGDKETEQLWSARETAMPARGGLHAITSAKLPGEELVTGLAALHAAVDARDVQAAMTTLCALVPEFAPSETVRGLAARNASRVVR
jgi:FlaA1/EpsC-like NDP-sugar epimerase